MPIPFLLNILVKIGFRLQNNLFIKENRKSFKKTSAKSSQAINERFESDVSPIYSWQSMTHLLTNFSLSANGREQMQNEVWVTIIKQHMSSTSKPRTTWTTSFSTPMLRDCAIIIRRRALKPEGGGALS